MWLDALMRCEGEGGKGEEEEEGEVEEEEEEEEGEEYDNLAVYNEALLATMGDYLLNDMLL